MGRPSGRAANRQSRKGTCARRFGALHWGRMLDLKAKLASAGLVSKEDVERVEREKARTRSGQRKNKSDPRARSRPNAHGRGGESGLPVGTLAGKPKGEIYAAVRSWVDKVRLDPPNGTPGETAQPFHFARVDGKIGRLVLEPQVIETLQAGSAGLIAFMSNHGLAHAVVPAAGARAVAELFPEWLRVLEGDERAGVVVRPGESESTHEPRSS
jgi:hypothetical protein